MNSVYASFPHSLAAFSAAGLILPLDNLNFNFLPVTGFMSILALLFLIADTTVAQRWFIIGGWGAAG